MVMVVVGLVGALLLADLLGVMLDVLLDGGDVGLGGGEIAGFEGLGELGNSGGEWLAALCADGGGDGRGLLAAGKELLERSEVTLGLR